MTEMFLKQRNIMLVMICSKLRHDAESDFKLRGWSSKNEATNFLG
jgi:hypothetical protein